MGHRHVRVRREPDTYALPPGTQAAIREIFSALPCSRMASSAQVTEVTEASAERLLQQIESRHRKGAHVVDAVGLAGLDSHRALAIGSDHGDAGMPGSVAVAA